ncbi:glycosyltransferase [Haliea sp. E1-2-M8]|uniref:glycosyltransferase n=1 Tax=Haliea sp. E1-2-M8 TaxID=3064706 RepID=UPI00271E0AE6|nr:glycosyltransferase [Haliea sp. E1-2-M8]MDO8863396.1 glycosyltransferase [Haliea sp. E1-2-M8]
MARIRIALFCMPEFGHMKRLLPIIANLTEVGVEPHVFSDQRFRSAIKASGGVFHDLFRQRPLAAADNRSRPIPCRYVSFAAHFAESVIAEVATLAPHLIIHDAFAVIARPVAECLQLPRVNICPGHNMPPRTAMSELQLDPRVQLDDACLRAVATLRDRYGLADASPFSYMGGLSTQLNLICEPPEFLTPAERSAFEPCAFFGSLGDDQPSPTGSTRNANPFPSAEEGTSKIYASLGTVIWRYYADAAWTLLQALSQAAHDRGDLAVLIALGGQSRECVPAGIAGPRVRLEEYVDQRQVLAQAGVFLTHQGLNSTHEAIFHGVPMLSYPFFSDQPGLARRCGELGLAETLTTEIRGTVTASNIHAALQRIQCGRGELSQRLADARTWELAVMAARPTVIERILALA